MKKIKNNYTNFILTVIAIAMIGILFKGEKIITSAQAIERHEHQWQDIVLRFQDGRIEDLQYFVKEVVGNRCWAMRTNSSNSPVRCQ